MVKKMNTTEKISKLCHANTASMGKKGKIKQKITHIVKDNSIVLLPTFKGFVFNPEGVPDSLKDRVREVPFLIYSEEVKSPHFWKYLSNTGMLDFHGGAATSFHGFPRRENTRGGIEPVFVDYDVILNTVEINAEVKGGSHKKAYLVEDKSFDALLSDLENGPVPLANFEELKNAYSSVSQTRAGNLVYVRKDQNRLELLKTLNFSLKAFMKESFGMVTFNAVKAYSRVKLSNSSAKVVNLFKGYKLFKEEEKSYSGAPNADGSFKKVINTVYVLRNEEGEEFKIEVAEGDFEVKLEQEAILPEFSSTLTDIAIKKKKYDFTRPATDGAIYMDADLAATMQDERENKLTSSSQFRFTPVGKGMVILVPGLLEQTGMGMIMFGGAVKGDIGVYFRRNEFDFYVLNEARRAKQDNSLLLSRQVFGALATHSPEILAGLTEQTVEVLNRAYQFESEALSQFIGIEELDEAGEEKVLDVDNLTVELFRASKKHFLSSSNNRRSAASLVNASIGQIKNGSKVFLKNAQILHMIVDPLTIVHYLTLGKFWLDASKERQRGVRAKQLIVSALNENGDFFIEHKKAFLARYPFLHQLEGQLVNSDGGSPFNDKGAYFSYSELIKKGHFQGLAIYSLWDMVPEGQSGADFDGDTTVYTTNTVVTDNVVENALFLDYSILDGELVEGVPWKDTESKLVMEDVVGKDRAIRLADKGVAFKNGVFTFDSSLSEDVELQEALADAMSELAAESNDSNNIGQFTFINTSVMEIIVMLQNTLAAIDSVEPTIELLKASVVIKQELRGYKKLSYLLACAIRWEIDKAKHGGQFMSKLGFLKIMIDGTDDIDLIKRYETDFGISLERLFCGSK